MAEKVKASSPTPVKQPPSASQSPLSGQIHPTPPTPTIVPKIDAEREFCVPQRAVRTPMDMTIWEKSEAYHEYMGFLLSMNEEIRGRSCEGTYSQSTTVESILNILEHLSTWVDEIPPIDQPQRFGNKAFRNWYLKLTSDTPGLFLGHLPEAFHVGIAEIQFYFMESFGNNTRIDYGTGHEMAFCMFLCCMFKIGALTETDKLAAGLVIFPRYLEVVRKLQRVYKMEPAGSRGVWALDDYQFIPFLWGSAQLIGHPHIEPSDFLKDDTIARYSSHYMFIACIKYILETKTGPFAEHSNQLWNISGVVTWEKVNQGLIKMYKGEVLSKYPVIQHVLFGTLLSIKPAEKIVTRPYHRIPQESNRETKKRTSYDDIPITPSMTDMTKDAPPDSKS